MKKRRFAGSGLTCQEDISICMQNKIGGKVKFFVYGDGHSTVDMNQAKLMNVEDIEVCSNKEAGRTQSLKKE